ncbi:hypothetical protein HDU99_000487, partial [Rhizoclosmatium hyalinum]
IALIVGRGTAPASTGTGLQWIPVDRFGGAFVGAPAAHLWMDFNDSAALARLPESSVDLIAVDWSTWRYLRPASKQVRNAWRRLLKPGACLVFEATAASVLLRQEKEFDFDFDNPVHVTVPRAWATQLGPPPLLPPIGIRDPVSAQQQQQQQSAQIPDWSTDQARERPHSASAHVSSASGPNSTRFGILPPRKRFSLNPGHLDQTITPTNSTAYAELVKMASLPSRPSNTQFNEITNDS